MPGWLWRLANGLLLALGVVGLALAGALWLGAADPPRAGPLLWQDDFKSGLERWAFVSQGEVEAAAPEGALRISFGPAGGQVVGDGVQRLRAPCASTFIGTGKAEEFANLCRQADVDTVIFDDELSPAQSRNLERVFNCKIIPG